MEIQEEEYWRKFAETFNEDQSYVVGEAIQQSIFEELSGEQNLGEVIEFGCGRGFYTQGFVNNSKHVVATDLSDEMLELARIDLKRFYNITFQKADCMSTIFPSGGFNTAVMMNLIHVIENPLNALLECQRIIKSGGRLIIASYTMHSMEEHHRNELGTRFLEKWGMPLPYFNGKLSPDHLAATLEKAGFSVEMSKILGDSTKALYLRARKE